MHPTKYTSASELLDFIERTVAHGVPLRVAIKRAERRYGVSFELLRALVRSA